MKSDSFYKNLALIEDRFGDRKLIPIKGVAEYLGVDVRTVRKYYPIKQLGRACYVSAVDLATRLS